jgi:hypothetical protein
LAGGLSSVISRTLPRRCVWTTLLMVLFLRLF